jgi:hypothetical protein
MRNFRGLALARSLDFLEVWPSPKPLNSSFFLHPFFACPPWRERSRTGQRRIFNFFDDFCSNWRFLISISDFRCQDRPDPAGLQLGPRQHATTCECCSLIEGIGSASPSNRDRWINFFARPYSWPRTILPAKRFSPWQTDAHRLELVPSFNTTLVLSKTPKSKQIPL